MLIEDIRMGTVQSGSASIGPTSRLYSPDGSFAPVVEIAPQLDDFRA